MDFKTQSEAILLRRQRAWAGFQQTIKASRVYSAIDIQNRNKWVKEIEAAEVEKKQWLSSIPTK